MYISISVFIIVLIETYWNVNNLRGADITAARSVLIETYWNVNSY